MSVWNLGTVFILGITLAVCWSADKEHMLPIKQKITKVERFANSCMYFGESGLQCWAVATGLKTYVFGLLEHV